MIPLSEPFLSGREWEYVKDCFDTGWVSSVGSYVNRFEELTAQRAGVRHAVATTCGTAALHVSLLVAGVQADDEVLISTLTFIAPANAIRYIGAWPVFVDAEPAYWQMDVARVRQFLEEGCERRADGVYNRTTGRRVAAVLPVHILGHPVDLAVLMEVARAWDLPVIEDATESLGSTYRGAPTGSLADIGCFSFNGNKILTTGGGGMVVTDRPDWAERVRYLTTQAKLDALESVHGEVGFNYRMTNIQAAMGCAQLEQLDEAVEARRGHAAFYRKALQSLEGASIVPEADWAVSNCWLSTVLLPDRFGLSERKTILTALAAVGVQTRPLWQPLHRSPAYPQAAVLGGAVADDLQARAISLPSSRGLSPVQRERVAAEFLKACASC